MGVLPVVVPFAEKQLMLLYSGEIGCVSLLVHDLQPTLTHSFKASHRHCDGHTNIDMSAKLCESSREGFPTRSVKGNAFPQPTCTKSSAWVVELLLRGHRLYQWADELLGGEAE